MLNLTDLLKEANQRKASDLHITVGASPKVRINGELINLEYGKLFPDDTKELAHSILTPHFERTLETEGEVDFSYSISDVGRYRVNVFRQRGSYGMVFRVVGLKIPDADSLGIPPSVIELTKKKRGLVLVTGPTGSGKSTSLASLVDIINEKQSVHVITLEDPIEYLHSHKKAVINQREIGLDTMSYGKALRASLREDPDVILVGEMRDLETISTAITAAETGHLVFSTLHTIGAAPTIDRIIDVFPTHQQQQIRVQLGSVLEAVVSQQLLPTADGKGRVAAFEVMHANAAIRNLIREAKTHQITSIMQTSRKLGMRTMDDSLYDLYMNRKISAEKAISYAQDPITLEKKIF